ncbi:integrase [Streptomyces sp. GS7]|nr:integrase [Streptomyces sp. GS7]
MRSGAWRRGGRAGQGPQTVQTRALHRYLRWRNANARHPDVLAAQRRERARIRSEKGIRWGGRARAAAA